MLPQWTYHLKDPEEKKSFQKYVQGSRGVLDRLLSITKDMESELGEREIHPDSYDSPSWAARQADINGYRRCLRRIQSLITLDQKDNENGRQPL